jgi:hypothetical protein
MLTDCEKALEPLRSMLAADGYLLRLETTVAAGDDLTLTVSAGPDACAECLVPVALFAEMVDRWLSDAGIHPSIIVVYPDGATA